MMLHSLSIRRLTQQVDHQGLTSIHRLMYYYIVFTYACNSLKPRTCFLLRPNDLKPMPKLFPRTYKLDKL
jgi:hypothetical protein